MKYFCSIVVVLSMLFGFSLESFAAAGWIDPNDFEVRDGDTYVGVLKTSTLSKTEKDFIREWLASDHNLLVYKSYPGMTLPSELCFFIFDSTPSGFFHSATASWAYFQAGSSALDYRVLTFDMSTKKMHQKHAYESAQLSPNGYYNLGNAGHVNIFSGTVLDYAPYDKLSNVFFADYEGRLFLEDDDGLLSDKEDPPVDPPIDPPDLPDPPAPPVVPPGNSDLVPYDTNVWQDFYKWVSAAIGNATTIGFMILMIVLGILLVIKIVRIFTR